MCCALISIPFYENHYLKLCLFPGVFALSSPMAQDEDCLWLISPFLYPTNSCTEVACIHELPGTALDIKGIPDTDELTQNSNTNGLPEVFRQHLPGQKQIVVLTVNGTAVFRAMKPYEQLKDLLVNKDGGESLKGHYELGMSAVQPLANTVMVAIHPSFRLESIVRMSVISIINNIRIIDKLIYFV